MVDEIAEAHGLVKAMVANYEAVRRIHVWTVPGADTRDGLRFACDTIEITYFDGRVTEKEYVAVALLDGLRRCVHAIIP